MDKLVINNRYEILENIGDGGMATVYRVYDLFLERTVALKILKKDVAGKTENILRFKREFEAVTLLKHINIVEVFDSDYFEDRPYLVMEYVKGKSLKYLLEKSGMMYPREAAMYIKQIAEGVKYAHSKGVVHRDIKPDNILIKSDGSVKISDFGIAVVENSPKITKTEFVIGSVHYMAPEVLTASSPASELSDIYAIGITFYELLVGDVPFNDKTTIGIGKKHLEEPLPSIIKANKQVSKELEQIVTKCCAKKRIERYSSVSEFLEALSKINFEEMENKISTKTKKKKNSFFARLKG